VILETIHFIKNKNKIDLVTRTFDEAYYNNSQLKTYTLRETLNEKHKIKFVLYENLLLDVTNFAEDHPGGKNLITDNLYSDISRYITGNQAYSTCFYAIKSLAYAKFFDEHSLVLRNDKTTYINNDMVFENKNWAAESTCELVFSNDAFKFPIFLPGVNWLGRHFAISSYELNKTRYYSLCLFLNKNIQQRANRLLDNISSLEAHEAIESLSIKESELYSSSLSFYIKKYDYKGALSAYLNQIQTATMSQINIRGPIVILR